VRDRFDTAICGPLFDGGGKVQKNSEEPCHETRRLRKSGAFFSAKMLARGARAGAVFVWETGAIDAGVQPMLKLRL
jgi:hypothetical protein